MEEIKELYRLDIKIDQLPKRINQGHGAHWTRSYVESKMWMNLVGMNVRFQIPPEPLERAELTLVRASSACPDFDGLVSSFKQVIDALKKLNIIKDDNMKVISKPSYNWEKAPRGKGFVRIIVEELRANI